MNTGAAVISEYQEYSYKKRINFILKNYCGIEEYIKGYEEILCDSIMVDRLVDRRDGYGDIGVRVQTSYTGDSKYIYVGTLNINASGKVESAKPHYLEVNGTVLGDDGYCDDVFDKIKSLGN